MMKTIPASPGKECKAKIDYPCTWQYRIIGESAGDISRRVTELLPEGEYVLTRANVSRSGRYISMNLELTVESEEMRLNLYQAIAAEPTVKVVL